MNGGVGTSDTIVNGGVGTSEIIVNGGVGTKKMTSIEDLKDLELRVRKGKAPDRVQIIVSSKATCCRLKGSPDVVEAIQQQIEKQGLQDRLELVLTGCLGFCQVEPVIIVQPDGVFYPDVTVEKVPGILRGVAEGAVQEEYLYRDPVTGESIRSERDIPFYAKQNRIILGANSHIDPSNIEDYIARGGYGAMGRCLSSLDRDEVVEEVKESGLRGRGGAGFPTGIKWEMVRKQRDSCKYVICNADEGDPGAYMDRSILESNPHSVLEGMIIGGYAMGASEGLIYVRNEYPLAIEHLTKAIKDATSSGILGESILGTDFNFTIRIARGAGAFVCGEETALINSIEGRKGNPKQKPPFPAQSGLFGRPTAINNVETWANIPLVIQEGGKSFSNIGTETSKGTKIFSLVGKVQNSGLVEVPMGTTISQIVYDIGGGASGGKDVKAIQIGGPSGGCIPRELFHLPIDYASLTEAGAIMGSGGLIVMDESTCMVDVAKYFMDFLQDESCGKCSVCREGTQRMHEILTNITEGRGNMEDLDLLEELGGVIKDTAMCGLGQTAPNPVLSTLRYYRDEYVSHIEAKACPAMHCEALIRYSIDPEKCTGCGLCKKNCPEQAISGELHEPHSIDPGGCIKCGICHEKCKFDAVLKQTGVVKSA